MRPAFLALALALFISDVQATPKRRATGPPPAARIVPREGPAAGGIPLTITGVAFDDPVTVLFGDSVVPHQRISATELRVIAPRHGNGYVSIEIRAGARRHVLEFLCLPPARDALRAGEVTTVAGIGRYLGEGRPATSTPVLPTDATADSDGNIFIAESNLGVVRRIGVDGIITRYAGIGVDFGTTLGDGGPARDATLIFPISATIAPNGNLYLTDSFNHRIRVVDRATGIITTVAGSGPIGSCCDGIFSGDGGRAIDARLNQPNQVVFDQRGNLFILDASNQRVRRVAPDGIITTVAGTGVAGFDGDGGLATAAKINIGPNGDTGSLDIDSAGNLYLVDRDNFRIRRIDANTGIIQTIAGGGTGSDDGILATSAFLLPWGIAIDGATVYFTDRDRIRTIDADGRIRTVVGTNNAGFSPDGSRAPDAMLTAPARIEFTKGSLLISEFGSARLRRFDLTTKRLTTVAGVGPELFGENGPGVRSLIEGPRSQLAIAKNGALLFGDAARIRQLDASGNVQTIAGGGIPYPGPPPTPRAALGVPVPSSGIAVEAAGNIYVASGFEVGRISPAGVYTKLAGGGYGYSGDGGPAIQAMLDNPGGLAIDAAGDLYVADTWNHRIRRINMSTGVISLVAGAAMVPHPPNVPIPNPSNGDGGRALDAMINLPEHLAFDAAGNLYFGDTNRIRMIDRAGIITTVLPGCYGPLTTDSLGRVHVCCGTVRRFDAPGNAVTLWSVGAYGFSGDGGPAEQAQFGFVSGIAVAADGDVFLFDAENRRIRVRRHD